MTDAIDQLIELDLQVLPAIEWPLDFDDNTVVMVPAPPAQVRAPPFHLRRDSSCHLPSLHSRRDSAPPHPPYIIIIIIIIIIRGNGLTPSIDQSID